MQESQNTKNVKKPLSDRAIRAMKPTGSFMADVGENSGLRVNCGSGGTKTFCYRYMSPETNKMTQVKIGNYPATTLAVARVELQKLKEIRKSGICPKAQRLREKQKLQNEKDKKQLEEKEKAFTVQDLIELYLTEYIEDRMVNGVRVPGKRKPKGQDETRRTLYNDAVKVLGGLPASKVTRKDVVGMVKGIVDRGAPVQAGNVLRELSSAYEFAIAWEHFDDSFSNPALQAKASLKRAYKNTLSSKQGTRILSDKEIVEFLKWLPNSGFSINQRNVLMLTLWTGCRTGEICEAKWRDIDLVDGVWLIRESKNGTSRKVQLSRQAISFLKTFKDDNNVYVFPTPSNDRPIRQKSLSEISWQLKNPEKLNNPKKYRKEQLWPESIGCWTPHDLRRTVRTGLASLRCPSEIAEVIIGHSLKGIEGTYNLHGYDEECKEWLQRWANHLDTLFEVDSKTLGL